MDWPFSIAKKMAMTLSKPTMIFRLFHQPLRVFTQEELGSTISVIEKAPRLHINKRVWYEILAMNFGKTLAGSWPGPTIKRIHTWHIIHFLSTRLPTRKATGSGSKPRARTLILASNSSLLKAGNLPKVGIADTFGPTASPSTNTTPKAHHRAWPSRWSRGSQMHWAHWVRGGTRPPQSPFEAAGQAMLTSPGFQCSEKLEVPVISLPSGPSRSPGFLFRWFALLWKGRDLAKTSLRPEMTSLGAEADLEDGSLNRKVLGYLTVEKTWKSNPSLALQPEA